MTNKYCTENLSVLQKFEVASLFIVEIVDCKWWDTRLGDCMQQVSSTDTKLLKHKHETRICFILLETGMITKSDWALGLGGGVIINYSGTVTWEVPFCSCRLFFSFIRGAMNQVSSFGILNKQDQELSLHNVSVYLVVKMNVQISAQQDPHTIWLIKTNSCFHPYLPSSNRWHEPQLRGAQVRLLRTASPAEIIVVKVM